MLETGSAPNQRKTGHQVPVWCARLNTTKFQEAELMRLDENRLVLLSDVPFHPRTTLFIRVCSAPVEGQAWLFSAGIRSVGIAEVKWCRKSDRISGSLYEMEVCYL